MADEVKVNNAEGDEMPDAGNEEASAEPAAGDVEDTDLDAQAASMADAVLKEAGLGGRPEVPPLPDFSQQLADAAANSIDMLHDVELNVKIELGRAEMSVDQILQLSNGSVVELDKLAGDPVDVLVNEQLIARGEVLVVNDNFCVRINEIIPGVSSRMGDAVIGDSVKRLT